MNRADKVARYAEEHGSVTTKDVQILCRTTTPTKAISECRAKLALQGKTFNGTWESYVNDEGDTIRYMRYAIGEMKA